ncbi:hypothetical protein K488DRAFT_73418 [Vararia minispora EC-137]|uniref:Uncharacterized protein n=1 Tax=Vararia minispora EC-137 TaxID=1314806 RepID=A0ACB8QB50_9AGAM|nr:hypothetical protein K488DRAFT_73418 [Vararia minispora EC-137]
MAHLTYEFVHLPCSKAFEEDQKMVLPAFDIMKSENPHPKWTGLQLGAPPEPTFWNVTAWDSSDAHRAWQSCAIFPSFYSAIIPVVADAANPRFDFFHSHFPSDPERALSAPLTQVTLLTPKQGKTRQEIEGLLEKMLGLMKESGAEGVLEAVVGTIEEHPEKVIVAIGWESKEHQEKASGPSGPAGHIIKEIDDLAEATSANTKFFKH